MTDTYDYDVVYIGSGHGAFDGAIPLAQAGQKVAIIEAEKIGGTCPNWGCNAKITLDQPVVWQRLSERLSGQVKGNPSFDWTSTVDHKHEVIAGLPNMIADLLTQSGVTLKQGYGHLVDAHTVQVDSEKVSAAKIVIATGQHPHRLAIPGSELAQDSRQFMDLTTLPNQLAILGSGYISLEFATIANAAGSEVTIFMHHNHVLRQFYQPYVEQLVADLKKRGVHFIKSAKVERIEQREHKLALTYQNDHIWQGDYILDATGRVPNVKELGLDELGIKYSDAGIEVNDHLQTSVSSVYATGDVVAKKQPKLTPTAIFESTYLTQLFTGKTQSAIDYPPIPSVVFTSPRIAQVGISVPSAQKLGLKLVDHHLPDNWYYQIDQQKIGDNTLIFDHDQLVGAVEISEQAEETINMLLPAIALKLTPTQRQRLITLFPTATGTTWDQVN